jgi:hypothetical protein
MSWVAFVLRMSVVSVGNPGSDPTPINPVLRALKNIGRHPY